MQKEIEIKHERVRKLLDYSKIDGLLMAKQSNLQWFTGGSMNYVITDDDISLVYLYITHEKRFLIATSSDMDRMMTEELSGLGFDTRLYQWHDQSPFDAIRRIKKDSKTGTDFYHPDTILMQSEISDSRRQMTGEEVRRLVELSIEYSRIVTDFCMKLQPGKTEREMAAGLVYECSLRGILLPVIMVGGDERTFKYRHPVYTDKRVKENILFATVGQRRGLNVPLSRVVSFGRAAKELKKKVKAVNFVEASAASRSTPGTMLKDVFRAIVQAYDEVGYPGEWKNHTQGGITNYRPCELGINPVSDIRLRENVAISFNPTIAGAKSEDIYLVDTNGPKQLSVDRRWPNSRLDVGKNSFYKTDILEI